MKAPIKNLINDLISEQIYRRTFTFDDTERQKMFLEDIKPAINNKLVRMETNDNEVTLTLLKFSNV